MTNILDIANQIATTTVDQSVAKAGGGGSYVMPEEGLAMLRFVGYVEVGKKFAKGRVVRGKVIPDKNVDQVWLVFELHGPKYPAKVNEDGTQDPIRMTVKMNTNYAGLSELSHTYKLFRRMNYEGKATHFSQLLGNAYIGNIRHDSWEGTKDGKPHKFERATFEDKDRNLTIRPPLREVYNEEDGTTTTVPFNVPPALSPLRLFVWNADEQLIGKLWDNIYIHKTGDGEYDPNVFQNQIKKAVNFEGSNIYNYLKAGGMVADTPPAHTAASLGLDTPDDDNPPTGKEDPTDPLAGM